jgi:RND superfamily putative drug exporter
MTRLLHRLGHASASHPFRVLLAWALVGLLAVGAAALWGGTLASDPSIPGSETDRAQDVLDRHFPDVAGSSATVVVAGSEHVAAEPSVATLRDDLAALDDVAAVSEPTPSRDGRTATVDVRYAVSAADVGASGYADLEGVVQRTRDAGLTAEVGGEVAFVNAPTPTSYAEGIGLALALVVLLVAFGSVIAAGLPLLTAVIGIAIGTAGIYLLASATTVSNEGPQIATMIGLGVGVDYALIMVSRHREMLAEGMTPVDAAARATATAGRAVLLAGGTVVVAILGLWTTGLVLLGSLGVAAAAVVLVAMAASVTLMPALLALAGRRLRARRAPTGPSRWARWARMVAGRPVAATAIGAVALLALAAPALDMEFGVIDAGSTDPTLTQRKAYDLIADAYGPGANGPLVVVAPASGTDELVRLLAGRPGVAQVSPPLPSADREEVLVTVVPATGPASAATERLVADLRHDLDAVGSDALVTGSAAATIDLQRAIERRLGLFVGVVVSVSALLLLVEFRSVLVPVKAALLTLLSVGASFGVLVVVFQWGVGAELIGVDGTLPISAIIPTFLFAVVFGLSMDYEVFLLSRVREEYEAGKEPVEAVAVGVGRTARVIGSAALVMVAVFGAFVAGSEPLLKMFGLGLAVAVLLDATVVRLVLVPAVMALLGNAAWWFPRMGGMTRRASIGRWRSEAGSASRDRAGV